MFLEASSPLDSCVCVLFFLGGGIPWCKKKSKEKSFACKNSIGKTSAERIKGSWSLVDVRDKQVCKQDLKQVCSKQPVLSLVSVHTTHVLKRTRRPRGKDSCCNQESEVPIRLPNHSTHYLALKKNKFMQCHHWQLPAAEDTNMARWRAGDPYLQTGVSWRFSQHFITRVICLSNHYSCQLECLRLILLVWPTAIYSPLV